MRLSQLARLIPEAIAHHGDLAIGTEYGPLAEGYQVIAGHFHLTHSAVTTANKPMIPAARRPKAKPAPAPTPASDPATQ